MHRPVIRIAVDGPARQGLPPARLLTFLLLVLLAGCGCDRRLLLSIDAFGIHVGAQSRPQAAVVRACSDSGFPSSYQYDNFDAPARFRWVSLDPAVATVDELGVIRGVSPGAARIEVTTSGLGPKRVLVQVWPPPEQPG